MTYVSVLLIQFLTHETNIISRPLARVTSARRIFFIDKCSDISFWMQTNVHQMGEQVLMKQEWIALRNESHINDPINDGNPIGLYERDYFFCLRTRVSYHLH